MKKKVLAMSAGGAAAGIVISQIITIIISYCVGDGQYYPVAPQLAQQCASPVNAVLLQTVLAAVYGAAAGGGSAVWQMESWSLLRQTATHFGILALGMLPISYALHWMEHSVSGVLAYVGIFVGIYAVIWLVLFCGIRRRVRQMNRMMQDLQEKQP